jgi:hypothetical protein
MKTVALIVTFATLTGLVFGAYVYNNPNDKSITVLVRTSNQSFDEALMSGLQQLYQTRIENGSGIVKINTAGTEVIAKVNMKDFQKLSHGDINSALFVRDYVSFD